MEEREQPINYSWQNPVLRESIYPFRKKKLLEFIMAFEEIDRLRDARANGMLDLATIQKMQEMREVLQEEHRRISADLHKALELSACSAINGCPRSRMPMRRSCVPSASIILTA